jgi:hypothetical protein
MAILATTIEEVAPSTTAAVPAAAMVAVQVVQPAAPAVQVAVEPVLVAVTSAVGDNFEFWGVFNI